MTGGDAALQARAQALRDSAADLLHEAAQSSDFTLRDTLTRKALQQIEAARRLLDGAKAPPSRLAKGLH
ncbi:MAG: hypothetical protein ACRYGM_08505 [Janthinobacterium lividum]